MARPAKTVDIYADYGEVITTTIKQFVEDNEGMTKSALYTKAGAEDAEGTRWRIGSRPEITKQPLRGHRLFHYRMLLRDISDDSRANKRSLMETEMNMYHTFYEIPEDVEPLGPGKPGCHRL